VKLLADLAEWERRMRLREFFYDEGEDKIESKDDIINAEEKCEVKKTSIFTSIKGRDMWLETKIEVVKNNIISNLGKSKCLNISSEELKALSELVWSLSTGKTTLTSFLRK